MKFRFISVLLVLLIAVTFCGCNHTDGTVDEVSTVASEATSLSDAQLTTSAASDNVMNTEPSASSGSAQQDANSSEIKDNSESDSDVSVTITESVGVTETAKGEPEIDFGDLM